MEIFVESVSLGTGFNEEKWEEEEVGQEKNEEALDQREIVDEVAVVLVAQFTEYVDLLRVVDLQSQGVLIGKLGKGDEVEVEQAEAEIQQGELDPFWNVEVHHEEREDELVRVDHDKHCEDFSAEESN